MILFLDGCASLPPPPEGELCDLDTVNYLAYCTDIPQAVKDPTHPINTVKSIGQLDHGKGTTAQTWNNIQVYIQQLKSAAQNKCSP